MSDSKPLYKIILLGDPAVGKTSIRRTFLGESFELNYMPTIGADLSMYETKDAKFSIWDIAGEHNYGLVRQQFYTGAHGIIFVFDISRLDTLDSFVKWNSEIREYTRNSNYPIMFVGNKIDLKETLELENNEIEIDEKLLSLRSKFDMDFPLLYSSALTGFNIEKLFNLIFEKIR